MALILFDYDGVLADTLDDLIQFGQIACDKLGVKHLVTKDDLNNLEVMSFSTFGRACQVPEHLNADFVEISLTLFAEKETPPHIFAGMSDVIRYFSRDHKMGVVTTNSSQNVSAFLAQHGLASDIHAIYGVDTAGTKAQKIVMAQHQFLENQKENVFMIGDSLSDIRAAKEAMVTSIAVTWGHQSVEILQRGKPNYVVSKPQHLIDVIEKH
jgi:phosphoglycolate phosphatase-like HAD superfamily hydrolase